MEFLIARDKDGLLFLYEDYPRREAERFMPCDNSVNYFEVDAGEFPEVTWENSPKKVELKLVEE